MESISVKVPATSANLGPGFDCLGVALSLWNSVKFESSGDGLNISIQGEGADVLSTTGDNMIVQAAMRVFQSVGKAFPENLKIRCENQIPLGSGLGSSSAAIVSGLLGANKLLGEPLDRTQILKLGVEIEGHPDNIAPALMGGLTISSMHAGEALTSQIALPEWSVGIVFPDITLSTAAARAALPEQISLKDAVSNIGNAALVVQALQAHDIDMLRIAMKDKLHQPYRLPLIPGAQAAIERANQMGGAAALSGAGPSVIVFTKESDTAVLQTMVSAFEEHEVAIRKTYQLTTL